jgi:hypothetical protein
LKTLRGDQQESFHSSWRVVPQQEDGGIIREFKLGPSAAAQKGGMKQKVFEVLLDVKCCKNLEDESAKMASLEVFQAGSWENKAGT